MKRALLVCLVLSCGTPPPELFIARDSDFSNYRSWISSEFEADVQTLETDGSVTGHRQGKRSIFINQRPPVGASEFPVGTMVVKEMADRTLAMVKRGGTYNAKGLVGWEYFEIFENLNKTMQIDWRGLGPPSGEIYGPRGSSCNTCHGADESLDGILDTDFRLKM